MLSALLAAGYQPKAIALNFNPDVPPPIRSTWRDGWPQAPSGGGARHARLRAAAGGAGLTAGSADAAFALLSPSYSLLGFNLGRFSRWCHRCEQRMWFVRSELLGLAAGQSLVSWGQMVRMFWHSAHARRSERSIVGRVRRGCADRGAHTQLLN